jgi:hypothetical protein
MRRAAALALALALLVLGSAVWAQLVVPPSTLVRIEGYIGAKSPDPNLLATWRINRNRDVYDLHVTQLLVLTGTVRPGDIIVGLRPFSPALSLLGNLNALQAFVTTPANQKVAITGYLHIEPPVRELILSTVEPMQTTPNVPTPDVPTPRPT